MSTGLYLFLEKSLGFEEEWHEDCDGLWAGVSETKKMVVNPQEVTSAFQPFMHDLARQVRQNEAKYDSQLVLMYQNIDQQPILSDYLTYFLELPDTARIQAIDLIVEIARSHQMVVILDEVKYSVVFYPNGLIFSNIKPLDRWREIAAKGADIPKPFAKTIAQFKKIAQPFVNELMAKNGFQAGKLPFFKEDNDGYVRDVELGKQYIALDYDKANYDGKFQIRFYIYICNNLATQIYNQFKFVSKQISLSITSDGLLNHIDYKKFLIGSVDELHLVLMRYEAHIFPKILDIATDIKGVDSLVNGSVNETVRDLIRDSFYGPFCLIFARLAGNPNFEGLVDQLSITPHLGGWGSNQPFKETEFPKLVKYLREEVPSNAVY